VGKDIAPGPLERRFAAYIEGLAEAAEHVDRNVPLKSYCTALLLPGERKSVEPMAARLNDAFMALRFAVAQRFLAATEIRFRPSAESPPPAASCALAGGFSRPPEPSLLPIEFEKLMVPREDTLWRCRIHLRSQANFAVTED
jgi:hypothetical protein